MHALEKRLGYSFADRALLSEALTHSSFSNENEGTPHFERLEFLGDAVLGMLVAEHGFIGQPTATEGELTTLRASWVQQETLAELAQDLQLVDAMRLGRGAQLEAERNGGLSARILASVFESVLGAVYLDGGLEAARAVLALGLGERWESVTTVLARDLRDPTTRLIEFFQREYGSVPRFDERDVGRVDSPMFVLTVRHGDRVLGEGQGTSKAIARRAASTAALRKLGLTDNE